MVGVAARVLGREARCGREEGKGAAAGGRKRGREGGMAASEERDEEAQGLRGAELEAARVRGDESEGETPYEPSDGDEPEHAISPRSEILRERKKMAMLSERLANQRHGQVESDEEGPAGDNGECASCHTAALPYGGSGRGLASSASSADATAREASASSHVCGDDDDKDGSGEAPYCRICFEGEDEKGEPLLSDLCGCSGTMAHLHKSCLTKWIAESKTLDCEICRQSFRLPQGEVDEWHAHFARSWPQRAAFGVQAGSGEEDYVDEDEAAFESVTNPCIRGCLQRLWRNRGVMNSTIIILVGTSILVMMSLVLYHFLSPTRENVVAGALPPGQNVYEPLNCTVQIDESSREVEKGPIGWLCGVSSSQIYKGDCRERVEEEPCGEWNQFTLLQSSIPRCFFGHGSICYVAIQPDPVTGGVCKDGVCTPFNSTNADIISKDAMQYQNGLLAQGRCVACV